jgi:hypothetical protein
LGGGVKELRMVDRTDDTQIFTRLGMNELEFANVLIATATIGPE